MKNNLFPVVLLSFIILLAGGCQFSSDNSKSTGKAKNDSIKIITKNFHDNPGSPIEWKIPMKLDKEGKFVRHGVAIRYSKSGKVIEKIPYVMGKKEGTRLTYHSTGKVYKEQPYKDNKLNGTCKRYDRQGKLTAEYPYRNGLPGTGLVEYTNLGKKRPVPKISVQKKDLIKTSGKYILVLSLTGKGTERIKSVQFYEGKLINGKYYHKNLAPARNISSKKGEIVITLPKGSSFNKTVNIVAVAKTSSGLKLILQKPVKIAVRRGM